MATDMAWVEVDLNAFKCNKHDNVPAAKSKEVSLETLVEREGTLVLKHVAYDA